MYIFLYKVVYIYFIVLKQYISIINALTVKIVQRFRFKGVLHIK